MARLLANRAGEDSSTSSRPPSSDDPYRREERGKPVAADPDGSAANSSDTAPEKAGKPDKNKTAKGSGKQPGAKGHWRCQPIVVSGEVAHAPMACAACGADLGPDLKRRCIANCICARSGHARLFQFLSSCAERLVRFRRRK